MSNHYLRNAYQSDPDYFLDEMLFNLDGMEDGIKRSIHHLGEMVEETEQACVSEAYSKLSERLQLDGVDIHARRDIDDLRRIITNAKQQGKRFEATPYDVTQSQTPIADLPKESLQASSDAVEINVLSTAAVTSALCFDSKKSGALLCAHLVNLQKLADALEAHMDIVKLHITQEDMDAFNSGDAV